MEKRKGKPYYVKERPRSDGDIKGKHESMKQSKKDCHVLAKAGGIHQKIQKLRMPVISDSL